MALGLPAPPCRCSMSSQQLLWLLGPPCPDPCARTPRTVHLPACSGAASARRASPWRRAPECHLLAVPPATRRVCATGLETRSRAILMPAGSESYAGCAGVSGAATWISGGPHQHNFRGDPSAVPRPSQEDARTPPPSPPGWRSGSGSPGGPHGSTDGRGHGHGRMAAVTAGGTVWGDQIGMTSL